MRVITTGISVAHSSLQIHKQLSSPCFYRGESFGYNPVVSTTGDF